MSRRSRTRVGGCSVGWARRRNGTFKLLLIFGHDVGVELGLSHDHARVMYDRARGVLRVVPHPDGETLVGSVNARPENCARMRDVRYSLYVDVPINTARGTFVVLEEKRRIPAAHAVLAGVLEVALPATVLAVLVVPQEPPPAPPPAPVQPLPRRVLVPPPAPAGYRRVTDTRTLAQGDGNLFGDPTPERSALGQGYRPGSGIARER